MKFPMIGVLAMLFLSGCATTQPDLISNHHTVIAPPVTLVQNCPKTSLPDEFKSNKDVTKFMVKSYNNNVRCRDAIDKLVKYYNDAQNTVK